MKNKIILYCTFIILFFFAIQFFFKSIGEHYLKKMIKIESKGYEYITKQDYNSYSTFREEFDFYKKLCIIDMDISKTNSLGIYLGRASQKEELFEQYLDENIDDFFDLFNDYYWEIFYDSISGVHKMKNFNPTIKRLMDSVKIEVIDTSLYNSSNPFRIIIHDTIYNRIKEGVN